MMLEIQTTCKDMEEAVKISRHLLKKKLVSCANYFPINSLYLWKCQIKNDKEVMIILKTNKKNAKKSVEEIKRLHSYELPAITISEVDASKETSDWIDSEIS